MGTIIELRYRNVYVGDINIGMPSDMSPEEVLEQKQDIVDKLIHKLVKDFPYMRDFQFYYPRGKKREVLHLFTCSREGRITYSHQ